MKQPKLVGVAARFTVPLANSTPSMRALVVVEASVVES
jgi:hypothetical protein